MSKLGCTCGHVIHDNTDNISYKARFLRDQDSEAHYGYAEDIAAFIEAIKAGQRVQWIKQYFSDIYPADLSNVSVVSDIVAKYNFEFESDLYQCQNCGRVLIQVQDENLYTSFSPDENNYRNLFESFK